MKKDLENRNDIVQLIDAFYQKATKDEIIGRFFTEVIQLSWEKHLPIMYNFWESVLFGTGSYRGNPILRHIELHQKSALQTIHFEQWQQLFFATLNEHFEGTKTEEAKQKVVMMAKLMQYKIEQSEGKGFVQ